MDIQTYKYSEYLVNKAEEAGVEQLYSDMFPGYMTDAYKNCSIDEIEAKYESGEIEDIPTEEYYVIDDNFSAIGVKLAPNDMTNKQYGVLEPDCEVICKDYDDMINYMQKTLKNH